MFLFSIHILSTFCVLLSAIVVVVTPRYSAAIFSVSLRPCHIANTTGAHKSPMRFRVRKKNSSDREKRIAKPEQNSRHTSQDNLTSHCWSAIILDWVRVLSLTRCESYLLIYDSLSLLTSLFSLSHSSFDVRSSIIVSNVISPHSSVSEWEGERRFNVKHESIHQVPVCWPSQLTLSTLCPCVFTITINKILKISTHKSAVLFVHYEKVNLKWKEN